MMECRNIDELMMEFLYRELDANSEAEMRSHLDECGRCSAELASLERTRKALRSLPESDPPPSVTALLLHEAAKRTPARAAASQGESEGVRAWLTGLFAPVVRHPALAAAASLVLVAGIAGYLSMKGKVSPSGTTIATQPSRELPGGAAATPARAPALTAEPRPEGRAAGDEANVWEPPAEKEQDRYGRLADPEEQSKLSETDLKGLAKDGYSQYESKPKPAKPDGNAGVVGGVDLGSGVSDPSYRGGKGGGVSHGLDDGLARNGTRSKAEEADGFANVPLEEEGGASDDSRRRAERRPLDAPANTLPRALDKAHQPPAGPAAGATPAPESAPQAAAPAPPPPAPAPVTTREGEKKAKAPTKTRATAADEDAELAQQSSSQSFKPGAPLSPPQTATAKRDEGKQDPSMLYKQALRAGAANNCQEVSRLRQLIQKVDPSFYEKRVRLDRELQKCDSQGRARKQLDNAAPSPAPSESNKRTDDAAISK